jgi:acetolactate synthase-1/2/3 large subunit
MPIPASLSTERPLPLTSELVAGADVVVRSLERENVEVCFGMPGGAILPIYDALARGSSVRHVLVRHEQGGGHMAEGYARASGRTGVVLATSGPGATNLVTPIADAQMDSTPLVCITGQVRTSLIGTNAFQECNIVDVVSPLVKKAWQVRNVTELGQTLHAAFKLARTGRPGPVLVDIPRDVQEARIDDHRQPRREPTQDVRPAPDLELVDAAAAAIAGAERPVLYVGGGAQQYPDEVMWFVEATRMPVVTTLMGKGAFPESHLLFIGWPGMHGTKAANRALHHADLIVAAGARFDDRVTGRVDRFAPFAKVVHIDVDRREFGKIRHADIALHSYLGAGLEAIARRLGGTSLADHGPWLEQLSTWRSQFPLGHAPAAPGQAIKPQDVVITVAETASPLRDVVWTTGVGQHQMWAMQYLPTDRARSFVTSGGLGTMGFGLPAAIGASLACPGSTVICIDGDGSFQMTVQELATAVAERVPVIVVVINNQALGMVRQWQTMFFEERLSASDLRAGMPSFATIARGYGAAGFEVSTLEELRAAVRQSVADRRPTVIDVLVDPSEVCFPMILPGGAAVDQLGWDDPLP